jgi:DNA-binding transcriptional ArsR family regulator
MEIARDPAEADSIVDFLPFFKAFCNPIRAQIIEFLLSGERCVCEMTGPLDQSQPLVSHHLALLRDAGLLRMRNEGTRTYYSIAYVERLRSAPPDPERTASACAVAAKAPAKRSAS